MNVVLAVTAPALVVGVWLLLRRIWGVSYLVPQWFCRGTSVVVDFSTWWWISA